MTAPAATDLQPLQSSSSSLCHRSTSLVFLIPLPSRLATSTYSPHTLFSSRIRSTKTFIPRPKKTQARKPRKLNSPKSSLTIPSNASLISNLTSPSQFSFKLSAQLVCCTNRCNNPHLIPFSCGERELVMKSVMRWEPRGSEGRRRGCCV